VRRTPTLSGPPHSPTTAYDGLLRLEDLLLTPDAGSEALYARNVLLDELEAPPSHGRALGPHDS